MSNDEGSPEGPSHGEGNLRVSRRTRSVAGSLSPPLDVRGWIVVLAAAGVWALFDLAGLPGAVSWLAAAAVGMILFRVPRLFRPAGRNDR